MQHNLFVGVYRNAGRIAAPAAGLLLDYRTRKGKEDPSRRGERLGRASRDRPRGPLVWVHAASVGEVNAVLPLVKRIRATGPHVLLTTGTVTSAKVATPHCRNGIVHQFVPLDMPPFVDRFLRHWRPDLALFVESELWPAIATALRQQNIPQVLVNGRMSDRSFRRWIRMPTVATAMIGGLSLCLAQSERDAERLRALGAAHVLFAGNLKFDSPPPAADPAALAALEAAIGRRPVWLAASTHPGEEADVMSVHRALKAHLPNLLTIIAPRHPDRGDEVAALGRAANAGVARHSVGEAIAADTDFYIVDTIGELGLFYRLAPVAFVGGSLVPHGGQNPIEPVKLGTMVVHGPHTDNFAEIYGALERAGGVARVANTEQLAKAVGALLSNAADRKRRTRLAAKALDPFVGALGRTVEALSPLLTPLAIHARLRETGNG